MKASFDDGYTGTAGIIAYIQTCRLVPNGFK